MSYILASGCSYTDPDYRITTPDTLGLEYLDRQIIPWDAWPAVIAKRLNKRCVNLGLSAAGNEYIINVLYDYILKAEEPPDEIYVMLSGWGRIGVFGQHFHPYQFLQAAEQRIELLKIIDPTAEQLAVLRKVEEYLCADDKFKPVRDFSFHLMKKHKFTIDKIINNNLMPLYIFCKFCADQHIKLTIAHGVRPWSWEIYFKDGAKNPEMMNLRKDLGDMNKVQEKLIDNFYFNKIEDLIDDDKISAILWPFFKGIGGHHINAYRPKRPILTHTISQYDNHPNAIGHEMFADYMMGKVV